MRVQHHFHKLKPKQFSLLSRHLHHNHHDTINLMDRSLSLLHHSPTARHLRHVHAHLLLTGLLHDVVLSTNLLHAYSFHGELLTSSYPLFLSMPHHNAHSWSLMLGELSRAGFPSAAIALFADVARARLVDAYSMPILLRSCGSTGEAEMGRVGHGMCVKIGLENNVFVGSAMVFMYVGLGEIGNARKVFDIIPHKDVVLWTTMLSGYAQREEPRLAITVFREMVEEGVELDGVVMVSLLLVCGRAGWVRVGKSVHGWCLRKCLRQGLSLGNALVDVYVKCGALRSAENVFRAMPTKDVISWTALIVGHGLNGDADHALRLFGRMAVRPNLVTYLGVLSACAHAGRVEEAWEHWGAMRRRGLEPEVKHYACMVDVLGRAGRLEEAARFVEAMPVEPDEVVWAALLAGCRVHGNEEIGKMAAERLMGLRPERSGYYVMVANVFSGSARFQEAERVREVMKERNVSKVPGCSSV